MQMSQNAKAAFASLVKELKPTEVYLSSLAEDRMTLEELIRKASTRGYVPFEHSRLGEIMNKYELGSWFVSSGNAVLVTDEWKKGLFNLEFALPPPVPLLPALTMVNFNREISQPYGLKHRFLFDTRR